LVDDGVGGDASAVEFVWPKRSSTDAPAVGTEKAAYVENEDATPVTLRAVARQPAPYDVAPAGQRTASPIEPARPPDAVHCATVMSVHALDPASDDEPNGHGYCVAKDVPRGQ